jgi:hypothetical protein
MKRLMPVSYVLVCLCLLVAGCTAGPTGPSPTPVRPTATSETVLPAGTATSVSVPPADTPTRPPKPTDTPRSEPTLALSSTPTVEARSAEYGSMIVMLMRAVNARERVVGVQQSTWGLEGNPDGGRDFPPLDALDNTTDLMPYVGALQYAVPNLVGRPDDPNYRSMFWNEDTETLYTSFAELNLHDGWRSSPEEGNLEEIRQVLERMHTIVVFGKAITMLVRFASADNTPGAEHDIDLLQNEVYHKVPATQLYCSLCPPAKYASHYVSNNYPAVQLSRAFLSFDTSRLAEGPPIVVHSVRLRVKHVIVLSQTNWDGSREPEEERLLQVVLTSGTWDPDTNTGTGWGLGPVAWHLEEEWENGWDSCPDDRSHSHLAVETVGQRDGVDTFTPRREDINVQGWTQFRIKLEDETRRAVPPLGDINWRLYGLSGHHRDHWLIMALAFPSLPPMPAAFE